MWNNPGLPYPAGGSVHWYHLWEKPRGTLSKSLWPSICILDQIPRILLTHLAIFAPTSRTTCQHLHHTWSSMLPGPPGMRWWRTPPGTQELVTHTAGGLTHIGLSFDAGRWAPVDNFFLFLIPETPTPITLIIKPQGEIPQAQQSEVFSAKLWLVQKFILTLSHLPFCLIPFPPLDSLWLYPLIKKLHLRFCLRLCFWRAQPKIHSQICLNGNKHINAQEGIYNIIHSSTFHRTLKLET